jgi:hypothetical protein
MQKASLILFTAAFVIGCIGLWLLSSLSEGIYAYHFRGHELPGYTKFVLENRTMFLVIPVPFVLLCLYALRRPLNTEAITLLAGVLAFVFMILLFGVPVVALLPCIPYME